MSCRTMDEIKCPFCNWEGTEASCILAQRGDLLVQQQDTLKCPNCKKVIPTGEEDPSAGDTEVPLPEMILN